MVEEKIVVEEKHQAGISEEAETADQLKEVKFGPMGKVAFYFKDSKQFFAMTVTEYAIPLVMQPVESKKFKPYIKEFARRVHRA